MLKEKPAPNLYPIHELIKNRWSTYGFDPNTPVEKEKINSILEAARWAPSSYNEQPWSYVIGFKGDEIHQKLADCLVEGNNWAKGAPVIILSITKKDFDFNKQFNRHYLHDTGAASAYMFLQAIDLGLGMHQMAGFSIEKAREHFNVGENYEPGSMIAVGYILKDLASLPKEIRERETKERSRKAFETMLWKN